MSLPGEVDVLVAGSGAAGLTAALAAAVSGVQVLLVERGEKLGGTTALSGGRVWVPGNHLQKGDSPAAAAAYTSGVFSDRYPEMTETFLRTGPEMLRFVESHSAHQFAACPSYPDYHQARPGATAGGRALDMVPVGIRRLTPLVADILTPPGYLPLSFAEWDRWRYPGAYDWDLLRERERTGIRTGGVALVAGLLDGVVRAGAGVLTGIRLTAVRPGQADLSHDGQVTTIGAAAVILATGGFDWNPELRAKHQPAAQRASGAPPTNTGDGLRIATEAGARTDNLAEGWWMPMLAIPGETLLGEQFYRSLIRERGLPRQIMVNATGRRFVNEALPYNEIGKALHGQHGPAFLIFDEGYRSRYPMPGISLNAPPPTWVASGATLAGLAQRIGADPAALAGTVRRWNESCATGADPDFGRGQDAYQRFCGDPEVRPNPSLGPLDQPPYYAVEVLAGTIGTKGGPVTDTDGRVLRAGGSPVPGLYAAGNAAAFWTADGYPGPGATLAVAMTMGYRAGRHAALAVR
ncbi:MAG TPA: FAD-dependent oxidoreductase [Streptosporangiaceae bacterium]|nr:FAD-dependent oxidoreductase [Streptosporangiaceae bacterium]